MGEREGKLSGESFPSLSPNPSPSSSKTFNWWGGRAKGVRSDASPKEQVSVGRLEQRFSPCPLMTLQCESSEVGPPKSSHCRVKGHLADMSREVCSILESALLPGVLWPRIR